MHLREHFLGTARFFNTSDPAGGSAAPAPAPAPAETPAAPASSAAPAPSPTPAPAPAEPAAAPKPDYRDARIAELTAKLHKTRAEKEELERSRTPPAETPPQAEFESRVVAEAQRLAAQKAWDDACNAVAAKGRTEFTQAAFDERLGKVLGQVDSQDPAEVEAYNGLVAAAIETGAGHKILFSLGDNPGEVRRLLSLSQTKRAIELAQMSHKLSAGAAPEPSGAPKPMVPLGSHGAHYEGIAPDNPEHGSKLPKADWFAKRQKQVEERGLQ